MSNYWVVGAMLGGEDDQFDKFVKRGYWRLGEREDQPTLTNRVNQICPGDRIAIKRMLGAASPKIEIRAIGVVKDIGSDTTVYVDWLVPNMERNVDAHGCFAAIHGPYLADDDWAKTVFML